MLTQPAFEGRCLPEPNSGCWLWRGAVETHNKYGRVKINQKTILAHRLSWALYKGEIPNGMFVLHKCDVPSCVNPDHLFLGSLADNVADMDAKGRRGPYPDNRGERHGMAKLADRTIPEIRRLYATGVTQRALASRFGVSIMAINRIVSHKGWTHVL